MDASDTSEQAECSCCGNRFAERDLARLLCHSDVALCGGCIGWLATQRQAVHRAVPVLETDDVAASTAFWQKAGFDVETYDDGFAAAHRDGVELHLVRPNPDHRDRGEAYLHAGDVDALHAVWRTAGLEVSEVRDEPWGMREFNAVDPGGNRIRVGRST